MKTGTITTDTNHYQPSVCVYIKTGYGLPSYAAQLSKVKQFTKALGYQVCKVFYDDYRSGRKNLEAMLDFLDNGRAMYAVVGQLDTIYNQKDPNQDRAQELLATKDKHFCIANLEVITTNIDLEMPFQFKPDELGLIK